jgi:hypothetical protein
MLVMNKREFLEGAGAATAAAAILASSTSAQAQGSDVNILVAYHSVTGNTEKMAQGVAEGVKSVAGANVNLKRVGDVTTATPATRLAVTPAGVPGAAPSSSSTSTEGATRSTNPVAASSAPATESSDFGSDPTVPRNFAPLISLLASAELVQSSRSRALEISGTLVSLSSSSFAAASKPSACRRSRDRARRSPAPSRSKSGA